MKCFTPTLVRWLACACLVLVGGSAWAADWLRFRGPAGAGTSGEKALPVEWKGDSNIVWRSAMPGHGASSPIVVGDRVFLTCFSGYGVAAENPGREEDLVRHVVALSRSDGVVAWQRTIPAAQPEAGFESFLRVHGYASSTPTSDGRRLYVFFGKSGVFAFDFDGKQLWRTDVGSGFSNWGSGASPVVVGDRLVVNASLERRSLFGLDTATGEVVWRVKKVNSSWSTPLMVDAGGGKRELVVYMHRRIVAFDPATGEEHWSCTTAEDQSYAAPSPVADEGVVYAYGGGAGTLLAIRTGGRGDVTESHVKWQTNGVGSGITSPVLYDGRLYCIGNRGIVSCVDPESGKVLYKSRLSGGGPLTLYASPLAADGKVYVVSRNGGTFVLAAGDEFRQLSHNRLSPDESVFNASPVVSRGQLLLRSNRFLYCIGTGDI